MNVQLFPADCLRPCGGSGCGSVVRKTDPPHGLRDHTDPGEENTNAERKP